MGGRAGSGRAVRVEGRAGRGGSAAEAEDQLGSLRRGQRRRRSRTWRARALDVNVRARKGPRVASDKGRLGSIELLVRFITLN